MWCIPPHADAAFVCAMEDVLAVYTRPYNPRFPQVCMDETNKQLTKEVRTPLPAAPGKVARYDSEYERNGVANLFIFYEPLAGRRHVAVTDQRTKQDWAHQIRTLLDVHYPDTEKIVLVMDNLNTHTGASLYEAFPPEEARRLLDRLEIHYTPKHGSWLNMAEAELGVLTGNALTAAFPTRKLWLVKRLPGKHAGTTPARAQTGALPHRMPVLNSNTFTQFYPCDGLLMDLYNVKLLPYLI